MAAGKKHQQSGLLANMQSFRVIGRLRECLYTLGYRLQIVFFNVDFQDVSAAMSLDVASLGATFLAVAMILHPPHALHCNKLFLHSPACHPLFTPPTRPSLAQDCCLGCHVAHDGRLSSRAAAVYRFLPRPSALSLRALRPSPNDSRCLPFFWS